MISKNVMKTDDYGDSVWYKVNCDCNSDDHITTIEMEYDKEFRMITLNFYKKYVWTSRYGDINWFERFWKRLTCSLKMFFTGWIEVEEYVILRGEDHINSFIEALEEGKQKVKEAMENENSTRTL